MSSEQEEPTLPPFYGGYVTLEGRIGKDVFGRVYVDRCTSDEEHLTKAVVPPGKERPECRVYLNDLLPQETIGKNVVVEIDVHITYRGATDA